MNTINDVIVSSISIMRRCTIHRVHVPHRTVIDGHSSQQRAKLFRT